VALNQWFENQKFLFVKVELLSDSNSNPMVGFVKPDLIDKVLGEVVSLHILILRANRVDLNSLQTLKYLMNNYEKLDLRVLTNVSGILSDSKEAKNEQIVLDNFRSLGSKVSFLAWDQRVTENAKFKDVMFLPEVKDSKARRSFPKKNTVGFYGKLAFERGLFDLLLAVYLNPRLQFRLMGYGYNSRYVYRSKKFVSLKSTPIAGLWSLAINYLAVIALRFKRVNFEEKYFHNEDEMAEEFNNCSAIYFSCSHSPYSSGLVYQSLATHVPVVWSDGNSAMAYVLRREFPQGLISKRQLFLPGGLNSFLNGIRDETPKSVFTWDDFDQALARCACRLN
jgi:glycosyltransferase involved in cell wall biosynthesis